MADNIMYLYCTSCNCHRIIADSFGSCWGTIVPTEKMAYQFIDFVNEHFFCGKDYSMMVQLRWKHGDPEKKLPDSSVEEKEWGS